MKLIKMEKVKDGKYLKNYELTYRNKAGKEKTYEIVSRKELSGIEDIGQKVSGLSIAAVNGDKLLLLREFRMGVNKIVYNLESLEDYNRAIVDYMSGMTDIYIVKIYNELINY